MQTFTMNDTECASAIKFQKKHKKCAQRPGVNGPMNIDYIFTPSSIGDCVGIKCSVCGKEENITDFSCF
jgi:hypothetical protein